MTSLEDFLRPSQKQLFKKLCKKFKDKILISKGNFILVHGQAPVMLVAHLDTVHDKLVRDICKTVDGNILMSPQGIGGDDRCGVFALVKAYQSAQIKPWLLFTCEEEIGGLGAKKFCQAHKQGQLSKDLNQLKCIIELDRKGSRDAVYYNCANPDFEAYIESKGFKIAQGSFSDISLIAPELGIVAVNLSSGYHNPHTLHEYINRSELNFTIQKVVEIIADAAKVDFPKFDYIESLTNKNSIRKIIFDDERPFSKTFFYKNQDDIPSSVPEEFIELYDTLLDFYSAAELEFFRQEYGSQIIPQLYREVLESYYGYPAYNDR